MSSEMDSVKKMMKDIQAEHAAEVAALKAENARAKDALNGLCEAHANLGQEAAELQAENVALKEEVERLKEALVSERQTVRAWIQANGRGGWIEEMRTKIASLKAQLARVTGPVTDETGWLIEKAVDGRPHWLMCAWTFTWTDDADNAIRFCRRMDAEQIASMMETEPISITEHSWTARAKERG